MSLRDKPYLAGSTGAGSSAQAQTHIVVEYDEDSLYSPSVLVSDPFIGDDQLEKSKIKLTEKGKDQALITVAERDDPDSTIELSYKDFEILKAIAEVFGELDKDDPVREAVTDRIKERRTRRTMKRLGSRG